MFSQTDTAVTQDDSNKFYQDSETGEFVYSYNKPKVIKSFEMTNTYSI
jgi:hypothetical protein